MNFDFKITTWERVEVPENKVEEIATKIKNGELTSSSQVFNFCEESSFEIIAEVEEQMTIEENGGCATIEIRNDDGVVVWDNGNEK